VSEFYLKLDASLTAGIGAAEYVRYFELMGVQRHLKAAGIFARLNHRDGKPGYMLDIPRTLSYIVELLPRHEELGYLVKLINERCLPALESRE
jgi:aminoglycoside/choline kinase family phosphotransferase